MPLSCALAPSPGRHFDCCFCLSVVNHTTESFVVCLKNKGRKVARVEVGKSFVYGMGPGPTGLLWLSFLLVFTWDRGTRTEQSSPQKPGPAVSRSAHALRFIVGLCCPHSAGTFMVELTSVLEAV